MAAAGRGIPGKEENSSNSREVDGKQSLSTPIFFLSSIREEKHTKSGLLPLHSLRIALSSSKVN